MPVPLFSKLTLKEPRPANPFGLNGNPDEVEKARLAAPAHACDHLDEVGIAKKSIASSRYLSRLFNLLPFKKCS